MKKIYSISLVALIPIVQLCSNETEQVTPVKPPKDLVVKTVDGFGNPVKSTIVYESRNCEYDFEKPQTATSNNHGITRLKVEPGYLQLYAEGFLHESYKCFTYSQMWIHLQFLGLRFQLL